MKQLSHQAQKTRRSSLFLRRACLETGIPLPALVTATAAKIKMESRQADVAAGAAAMAGAMTRIRHIMPVAAVPAVAAVTWGVVSAAMAGAVTWRVVPAAVAGAMTGIVSPAMARAMTRGVAISRLHSGRGEDGEAGSDSQEGDEFFHVALGLSVRRQSAACQSDVRVTTPFNHRAYFILPTHFPRHAVKASTESAHGLEN